MKLNFLNLYKVDIDDFNHFDLVLDTSLLTPEQVFDKLHQSMEVLNND